MEQSYQPVKPGSEEDLLQKMKEKSKEKKKELRNAAEQKSKFKKEIYFSKFSIILTSMVFVLIVLVFYFIWVINNTGPWSSKTLSGTMKYNDSYVTKADLDEEDFIATGPSSEAQITIADEAVINLLSDTRLQVIKTKRSLNRIVLHSGQIVFTPVSYSPNFELDYLRTVVRAMHAKYSASVNPSGALIVKCVSDYIEITTPVDQIFLANDYACKVYLNDILSLPYNIYATDAFREQLNNLERNSSDIVALTSLLYNAEEKDALTLIRLLEMVPSKNREIIFRKLSNFFPPPNTVTFAGILSGNKDMLNEWWFEIEWQI
jgi:flagellar basal body-associated protein FliL